MDYSNRILRKDYFEKLNDLYDQRVNKNKLTDYVKMVLVIQSTSEILAHPELFDSLEDYEEFVLNNPINEDTRTFYNVSILPSIRQSFYTQINSQFTAQINQQRRDKYGFDGEYKLREVCNELSDYQSDQLVTFIENRSKKYTNTIEDNLNTNRIAEQLTQDTNRVNLIIRQQELQKDNVLRYTTELLKPEEEQKRYKTWVWTPNPHTRHSQMANTTVPLEEDFLVKSDQAKCPDQYLRYPLDPRGSDCQCINCMCTIVFQDNKMENVT